DLAYAQPGDGEKEDVTVGSSAVGSASFATRPRRRGGSRDANRERWPLSKARVFMEAITVVAIGGLRP
ncbi:unnamed protein product, partial [Urochloa humidicola]